MSKGKAFHVEIGRNRIGMEKKFEKKEKGGAGGTGRPAL